VQIVHRASQLVTKKSRRVFHTQARGFRPDFSCCQYNSHATGYNMVRRVASIISITTVRIVDARRIVCSRITEESRRRSSSIRRRRIAIPRIIQTRGTDIIRRRRERPVVMRSMASKSSFVVVWFHRGSYGECHGTNILHGNHAGQRRIDDDRYGVP